MDMFIQCFAFASDWQKNSQGNNQEIKAVTLVKINLLCIC